MAIEELQQRARLLGRPSFKPEREARVHVQRLASAVWVRDHHRMNRILSCQFGLADAALHVGAFHAKHVPAGVVRPQPAQGLLQPVRKRIISRIHAGEQRVPAGGRNLSRIQNRAHRRHLVVAVVGMPTPADVARLVRLLRHQRDFRVVLDMGKEAIDVDAAKTAGQRDVLLRRHPLVAKEYHAAVGEGAPDRLQDEIGHRFRQVHAADLGADGTANRTNLD